MGGEQELFGLVPMAPAPTTQAGRRAEAEAAGYGYDADTWGWVNVGIGNPAAARRAQRGAEGRAENAMRNRASAAGRTPTEQRAWEKKTNYKDVFGDALIKKEEEYAAAKKAQEHKENLERLAKQEEQRQKDIERQQRALDEIATATLEIPRSKPTLEETLRPRTWYGNAPKPKLVQIDAQPEPAADPALAVSNNTFQVKLPTTNEWVARVLYVKEIPAPNDKWSYENAPAKYYEIRARRVAARGWFLEVNPGADPENSDLVLPDPCIIDLQIKDKSGGSRGATDKERVNAIFMHPVYKPKTINMRIPTPGDLINVSLEPGRTTGYYTGYIVNRPIPDEIKDYRSPQSTKAKLAKDFPRKKEEEKTKGGCANGNVSDNEIANLKYIIFKGKNRWPKGMISNLQPNAKRFLKALDEEAKDAKTRIRINSAIRSDISQTYVMYHNWQSEAEPDSVRLDPFGSSDEYIRKLYSFWGKRDVEKMLKVFREIHKQKGWKKASKATKSNGATIAAKHRSGHAKGYAFDLSFKVGNTATNWMVIKKAAKRTCSRILVEKDHWHVSAKSGQKFGWSTEKFGRRFGWLESKKGPPKE